MLKQRCVSDDNIFISDGQGWDPVFRTVQGPHRNGGNNAMKTGQDMTPIVATVPCRANYPGDCRAGLGQPGPTRQAFMNIVRQTGKRLFGKTAGEIAGRIGLGGKL